MRGGKSLKVIIFYFSGFGKIVINLCRALNEGRAKNIKNKKIFF